MQVRPRFRLQPPSMRAWVWHRRARSRRIQPDVLCKGSSTQLRHV